ncbi:MAG: LPS assembly lipoprotein LptE [Xanthomonadales bacterium]|nr:LPS assembly lipoprotein LptE [Xanthomonadales bacterium]
MKIKILDPRILTLLLSVFLLSACGFQLRGDYGLEQRLGKTSLQLANEYSDFSRKLERSLERAGVELVAVEAADSIIIISNSKFTREVLSIGNDARVREFRLRLEVGFSVVAASPPGDDEDAETRVRLKPQVLKQQRDLRFDAGRVLATSRESEFLQEEMSDTLVRQFMQRLSQMDLL